MENGSETKRNIRVLCRKLLITNDEPRLQWLIGSPFFPQFTIVSTIRCLHGDPTEPDYSKEADDLRTLILRGFEVIGALVVSDHNFEDNAKKAAEAARRIRRLLSVYCDGAGDSVIGAAAELSTGETRFFVSKTGNSSTFEPSTDVYYEDCPEKFVWETGCLLRCEVGIKLPVFVPVNRPADAEDIFSSAIDGTAAMLRDPKIVFMVDGEDEASEGLSSTVILRGADLDLDTGLSGVKFQRNIDAKSCAKSLPCSAFCAYNKPFSSLAVWESAGTIKVTVLLNQSVNSSSFSAPVAEYFPVSEATKCSVVSFKLEVLCYAGKDLPLASAISMLVVPALGDQLLTMKKAFLPCLLSKHPQLHPYHFCPPGILHPLTIIYELSYGEKEMKQVELRRKLHLRLGLPLDRPLLLIANALNFATKKGVAATNSIKNASPLLKDVHIEVPSSGVSGGLVSLVDGSYEYYHYLQNGFDDSGWGCAYRSLQTIVSWFKQQHYTSIEVPSHREIQQALVEIGDKDPSFVDSREWIGAIELSFVLDKLLGVSCKIINVRSGSELPEKCRELALHFENQGTPVMIGGGVLAYTLLGVEYNEATGDSAFLILDPHYTGSDDPKKVINGGWCGWKKPVDSKGRNFFLHDKFYNLLLPQRPNWV